MDVEKQRAVETRAALEEMMAGHPALSQYTSFYVKPEDASRLTPEDIVMMRMYTSSRTRPGSSPSRSGSRSQERPARQGSACINSRLPLSVWIAAIPGFGFERVHYTAVHYLAVGTKTVLQGFSSRRNTTDEACQLICTCKACFRQRSGGGHEQAPRHIHAC